jgi:hypothetical protein
VTKINNGDTFWRVGLNVSGAPDFLNAIALDQNTGAFDVMPGSNVQDSPGP